MSALVRRALMQAGKRRVTNDPYFANVALLMHMDGVDNGTVFTEQKGKIVTRNGGVVTKTGVKRFGTASAYFNGISDWLTVPYSSDLRFGSGNFSIEVSIYLSGYAVNNEGYYKGTVVSRDVYLGREFVLNIEGTANSYTSIAFAGFSDNSSGYTIVSAYFTFNLNQLYNIEVTRNGNLVYIFVDGILLNPGGTAFSRTIQNTTTPLLIGASNFDASYLYRFNGYIDDLRITTGISRHTANFPLPTEPFPDF
jgi:hypothetical protein